MGRTNQRLINYNTGVQGRIPEATALTQGEIAVRYNQNDPALFIVAEDSATVITFIASGAVSTAIENAQGNVSSLSAAVETFSGAVDTYKTTTDGRLDNLAASAHTHENKSVLDGISDDQITGWDLASAQTHTHSNKALLDTYTQTESDLADAVLKKHEHTNMGVLTALTAEEVAKWNASAHNHSNKDVLDGITSEKVTAWDNAVNSAITGVTVNDEPATISSHVAEITISTATTATNGLMSAADKTRLDGIESGAQVNIIESVKVDGTELTITDKAVDVDLSSYPTKAEYNSTDKKIYFKHTEGGNVLTDMTIDATAFIKDGMVDNVTIGTNSATSEQCLIVTFNTEAGKEPIYIKIDDIFDADNYYTKTAADAQISAATAAASAASVNSAKTYTDEVSGNIATLVYTKADKTEVTTLSGNVVTELNKKVDVEEGKGLSTNDFDNAYKGKLDEIASGAEVNVQSDWNETDNTSDAYIQNKPTKLSDFDNDLNFVATSTLTSTYATSADTYDAITAATGDVSELSGAVITIESNLDTLSGKVFNDYITSASVYTNYATSANVQSALDKKADKTTFETVSGVVEDNKNDIAELSGSVFDNYFTLASATTALGAKADLDNFQTVSGVVETNSGNIYTLSGEVVSHYATSADTYNAITAATSDVSELSGSVETVETNLNTLSGEIFSHYATSADTYNAIDAVDDKVEALSGVTPNDIVFTTISDADANHTQSGAKSNYDTNSQAMQLDLTNLVIDCGTF